MCVRKVILPIGNWAVDVQLHMNFLLHDFLSVRYICFNQNHYASCDMVTIRFMTHEN